MIYAYTVLIVYHMVCKKKTCTRVQLYLYTYMIVLNRGTQGRGSLPDHSRNLNRIFGATSWTLENSWVGKLLDMNTLELRIHDSKLWYLTVTATSVVAVSVLSKWHFLLLWWFLMVSHVYCFQSSIMEPRLIDPTGTRLRMMAVKRENGACRQQLHWTYLWWKWRKWWKWWKMDQLLFFPLLILLQLQQLLLLLGQRNLARLIATAEHGPEICRLW